MAKPETTFTNGVHKYLPAGRKNPYYIKNHNEFNGGQADVWYSGPKADLWIEFKYEKLPVRDTTIVSIDLSELQKEWLRERHLEGRNVAVIVGCEKGGVIYRYPDWLAPQTKADFVPLIQTRQKLAEWILTQTVKG